MEFDRRIERYEKLARLKDGKGHMVNVDPDTRIYREIGHGPRFRHWLREVLQSFDGDLIPFEWVAEYVGVSRAALHKRVSRGGLTVLAFQMQERVTGVLGGTRERMRKEYKFVPKQECDYWRDLLMEVEDDQ